MARARYELLPEDKTYYGEIPDLQGVWANAETLDECRQELQEVLEDWLVVGIKLGHAIPVVGGIDLNAKVPA
jgi:predicted RNase H-like HicB family nuclease